MVEAGGGDAERVRRGVRQDVVTWAGRDQDGNPLLDTFIQSPSKRDDRSYRPSEKQVDAVARLIGRQEAEEYDAEQAHKLLNWRDFASAIVEWLGPAFDSRHQRMLPMILIAYLSQTPEMGERVSQYMNARFNRGADPDTLHSSVQRLSWADPILAFLFALKADLSEWEATNPDPGGVRLNADA